MTFQFFSLEAGSLGLPVLKALGDQFDVPQASRNVTAAYQEVARQYSSLIENRTTNGHIIVISETIGDAPGSVVAVEDISRRYALLWVNEELNRQILIEGNEKASGGYGIVQKPQR